MPAVCRSAATYAHAVKVQAGEIDFMGHVNNAAYLRWVQDAIAAHWHATVGSDAIAAHAWVALNHEITYRKPAFMHDEIVAVVRLADLIGECALYDTAIVRDEETLATARSRWCCVDPATRAPTQLPAAVVHRLYGPPR